MSITRHQALEIITAELDLYLKHGTKDQSKTAQGFGSWLVASDEPVLGYEIKEQKTESSQLFQCGRLERHQSHYFWEGKARRQCYGSPLGEVKE